MVDDDDNVASAATVDDSVAAATPSVTVSASPTATTAAQDALPAPTPDDGKLRPGDHIGRYEIVKMLGQGGMGMVYLAYDPTLDRPVALKLLRPELRGAQARLLREGQSVARLAHPNVVRVYDVGAERDDLFIAMEYVDGSTLRRWLRDEKRPPRVILDLFAAAGHGLAAAHAAGLVHRDFKPDNVLVGRDGRVVVTDFGLARLDAEDVAPAGASPRLQPMTMTLTRTGSLLGTPAYMSPEQLRGEVADARSDQWSFCVACWEALFGARPFALPERATLDDVRKVVEAGAIVTPAHITAALAPVERALRRGLSTDPRDRFPDIGALLAALVPARSRDAMLPVAVEGERIAHFRVIARLGQGGMGIVYRARDEKLGRDVALKVLPSDVLSRADRRERFLREARAAAAIVHPAIATVYEVGTDGDVPYIAMEYVAGKTLRETLSRGAMDPVPLIKVAIPIADALARAHKAGVVHRDLKPENVMLDGDGAPKILDFGVARIFDTASPAASSEAPPPVVTSEGVVLGTPAYMSPEQARGRPVDGRSDLFSLGTMLFELLCGVAPFRGASSIDIATAIIRDDPPPPSQRAPQTPLELDRIVLKCLEKDPADRYQDAAELVVDLRRLLRQTETGIALSGAHVTVPSRRPRKRWPIAAAGAAVIAAGVGGVIALSGSRTPREATAPPPPALVHGVDRALTSSANRSFQAGRLSPDGKTLALATDGRLLLQDITSGTTRELPAPATRPNWVAWFPDGRSLLLGEPSRADRLDLVVTPIDGSAPHTLPLHSYWASVSPDQKRLALVDEGGLRVAHLDGSEPRLLVGTRERADFGAPSWSPDGRWIAYSLQGPDLVPSIRAVTTDGSSDVLVVADPATAPIAGVPSYDWLGDGRLVYATYTESRSTILAVAIDAATGHAAGAAVEVAHYPDLALIENGSRDGRELLIGRASLIISAYEGDARAPAPVLRPTANQSWRPLGSSSDGTALYYSEQGGRREILAVGADGKPRLVTSIGGRLWDPSLAPDGRSVLYVELDAASNTLLVRRVGVDGAAPITIERLPYRPSEPPAYTEERVVQLRCTRRQEAGCVLGATENGDQVFYAVDPDRGRGRVIARLHGPPAWQWDVSPNGARLIVAHGEGPIVAIVTATGASREVVAQAQMSVSGVACLGDTNAFVIAGSLADGDHVQRIGPDGARATIWSSANEGVSRLRTVDNEIWIETDAWTHAYWLRESR